MPINLIERSRFLASGQDDPHSVTITELCDAVEALTVALEPFAPKQLAGLEGVLWGEYGDDEPASLTVKLGDIRRARTALAQARAGKHRNPS